MGVAGRKQNTQWFCPHLSRINAPWRLELKFEFSHERRFFQSDDHRGTSFSSISSEQPFSCVTSRIGFVMLPGIKVVRMGLFDNIQYSFLASSEQCTAFDSIGNAYLNY